MEPGSDASCRAPRTDGHARSIEALLADRAGATAIEYALIAALVAIGSLAALNQLGGQTKATYEYIQSSYEKAAEGS